MKDLVESLAVKDGKILNLQWHEMRYQRSYAECYGQKAAANLLDDLAITIPEKGYHKLRIEYDRDTKKVDIQAYQIQEINTLKVIVDNEIDYHLKYTDRIALNALYEQRASCDDIIIIKDAYVTDTFAGNILFFDGKQWYTPSTPLLAGIMRFSLLQTGAIKEKDIQVDDIMGFKGFQVINAMRPFFETKYTPIENIVF